MIECRHKPVDGRCVVCGYLLEDTESRLARAKKRVRDARRPVDAAAVERAILRLPLAERAR